VCPIVIEVDSQGVDTEELMAGPLGELRGVMIAIDDAGAGYESLARIEALKPSFMKLHRGAVTGIEQDTARQTFVKMLVTFADEHGCRIIAEGVETEDERDALHRAGVHLGQGYFVGRPVPIDRMKSKVETR
jgi:EAL domain-containing protein (putative c-di-GMP-specific phosphodiesterase class I)